eukprot:12266717-Prorocentrum_lima.AAC.1
MERSKREVEMKLAAALKAQAAAEAQRKAKAAAEAQRVSSAKAAKEWARKTWANKMGYSMDGSQGGVGWLLFAG